MSNNCNDIAKILLTEGTNQLQRTELALDPTTLKIHGFGMEEWMKFAENFAGHLHFYNTNSDSTPDSDWKNFFPSDSEIAGVIKSLEEADNLTPHLTLFVCFLKLLELPNQRLNNLTKRHLDYYYQEVLQIEKLPATYDKVHILFELSKSIASAPFSEGLELNGGKDSLNKLRIYQLIEELAGNKATVSSIRNFYMAPTLGTTQPLVKAALMANSSDGLGAALSEGETEWYPFGYDRADAGVNSESFKEIQDAEVGFSVASDILLMNEGERHVQFTIEYQVKQDNIADNDIGDVNVNDIINNITVYYTGEKQWIKLHNRPLETDEDPETVPSLLLNNSVNSNLATTNFRTAISAEVTNTTTGKKTRKLTLYAVVDTDYEAVTGYNQEVHGASYATDKPMFRFMIDVTTTAGKDLLKKLNGKINTIRIDLNVGEMYNVKLQNDLGTLNPSKPMYPFSTNPFNGSNFTIESTEIFEKKWSEIQLEVVWKNAPDEFDEHYAGYGIDFESGSANSNLRSPRRYGNAFPTSPAIRTGIGNYQYFQARKGMQINNTWINSPNSQLFTSRDTDAIYKTNVTFVSGNLNDSDQVDSIRMQLTSSFFHDLYPEKYAVAIAKKITTPDTTIPNKPYTPYAEQITIGYKASTSLDLNSLLVTSEQSAILYHVHPFGHSEEHAIIKTALDFVSDKGCTLIPKYCPGGELYIGLTNALPLQTIPLLFQISEGTENTELTSFGADNGIVWEVLCDNHWKSFENSEILKNEVDNFLKTGIVSLKLPKEVTSTNTLLPADHQWIRARLKSFRYDVVCKFIGIHSQVVVAQFTDNGNDTSHLKTGLPAETIAKLIERSSAVKSVLQPYNSFGGTLEEDDNSYYRRVSERLRHKKRAVTIWDYEHLALQYFPDIYRAKCLSHTSPDSFNAAGSVTMVVIPDTVNKNVFNIFEPRVSTAYLNEIKTFLSQYTSLHVNLTVMNPVYEAVKIVTAVRFNEGYDELLYQSILKEDLTKLLAPWAFDETKQVEFGGTLHKSVLIDYIENLVYVDYIQSIGIYVPPKPYLGNDGPSYESYTASSPFSIIVSSKDHEVSLAAKPCATEEVVQTTEECN